MKLRVVVFFALFFSQMHAFDALQSHILGGILYSGDIASVDLERALKQMILDVQPSRAVYDFDSIDMPGIYKLADNVPNQITISASNVTLDMNGCTVSGGTNGIVINGGLSNVTIKNGVVDSVSSDGIQVGAGCSDIQILDVEVKNALRGIDFEQVTNGVIQNCDLNFSTTGLELDTCHNITVQNCTARANTHAGFDLLSSTTCSVIECSAFSTGDGNSNTSSEVFGFLAKDGNGNLFERCIANATQALSVTGSDSVVAGFALRGDESCSKIIDSEGSNSQTSVSGVSVPYGILIENSFDSLTTLTIVESIGGSDRVDELVWSPDGRYYAVVGNINQVFNVVAYNYQSNTTMPFATFNTSSLSELLSVTWHPSGNFIVIAGNSTGNNIVLLEFDAQSATVSQKDSQKYNNRILSTNWSPDGRFLAIAGYAIGGISAQIYEFDATAQTLTFRDSISSTGNSFGITWSPDDAYVAVASANAAANEVAVYAFDSATKTVSLVDGASGLNFTGSVAWSPDGNYLLSFGAPTTSALRLYAFDGTVLTLKDVDTSIATITGNSSHFSSISWSEDGNYFAIAGVNTPFTGMAVYLFDRGTETFSQVDTWVDPLGSPTGYVEWSPDGSILAVGRGNNAPTENTIIFTGFQFPQNNVIQNNTIYCNSGAQFPSGIGISGSSISNSILQNTAFNNPIPRGDRAPVVSSNYAFATNVFNQLFGDAPTLLQNISLSGIDPVLDRYDIPRGLNRLEALAESLIDNLL